MLQLPNIPGFHSLKRILQRAKALLIIRKNTANSFLLQQACSEITARISSPLFVKVGANDGLTSDPFGVLFLADPRWQGILIEPVPYVCTRLRNNYSAERFEIVEAAVGTAPGKVPFYYVSEDFYHSGLPEAKFHFDQLGSFDPEHIRRHFKGVLDPYITAMNVSVVRLNDLLDSRSHTAVHVLHVDAEGSDYDVLHALDLQRFAPQIILVEHKNLSRFQRRAMRRLLLDSGYQLTDFGSDFYARLTESISSPL